MRNRFEIAFCFIVIFAEFNLISAQNGQESSCTKATAFSK